MGMENESAADMLRQHMATWNILTDDMQGSSAAGQAGSEGGDGDGSSAAGQAGAAAGEGDGSRAAGQAGTAAGDYGDVPGEGEPEGDGPGGPMSMMETDAVTIFHVQVTGVPVLGTVDVEVETASEDEETAILDMVKRPATVVGGGGDPDQAQRLGALQPGQSHALEHAIERAQAPRCPIHTLVAFVV